ncbi:MAG: molybdate ABC transporter permease subunit [Dehalococcoidia bacterium]|nr:molybdate ABC transporter permease subunit [Dehalococcoidia bacterium]
MDTYLSPIWISVRTVLTATAITFFLGIGAAHWLGRYTGRFRSIMDGIFILPMVLPPTVVGFILLVIFGRNGPIGKILMEIGVNIIFSWWATVIAAVVMAFPLMYMTTRGAFEQVEPNIKDAARTLGASEWRVFWTVTMPLAWPGVAAATVLALARTLGEFGATLMLAGNIPGRTATIPVAIYFSIQANDYQSAAVMAGIVMIFSVVALAAVSYWQRRASRSRRVIIS